MVGLDPHHPRVVKEILRKDRWRDDSVRLNAPVKCGRRDGRPHWDYHQGRLVQWGRVKSCADKAEPPDRWKDFLALTVQEADHAEAGTAAGPKAVSSQSL